jgi:hypothetical protein
MMEDARYSEMLPLFTEKAAPYHNPSDQNLNTDIAALKISDLLLFFIKFSS